MLRLGLCCTFRAAPIRFRTTTAARLGALAPRARGALLAGIGRDNAAAVAAAIAFCLEHGVGAYRVKSDLFPVATHPAVGYRLEGIDGDGAIRAALEDAGRRARAGGLRLSLHPDQFVVPGSADEATAIAGLRELEQQAVLARLLGAEQLTIHGGGAQGGKPAALERLARALDRLSPAARPLVVLENDDRVYTPADLLPACARLGVALVYDVHHHRANPDGTSIAEATEAAAASWGGREPWAHVSSPRGGWRGPSPRSHADFVAVADLPALWRRRRMTVDVEAKAKEVAVLRLARSLARGVDPAPESAV